MSRLSRFAGNVSPMSNTFAGRVSMSLIVLCGVIGGFVAVSKRVAVLPGVAGCRTLTPTLVQECVERRAASEAAEEGVATALRSVERAARHHQLIGLVCHRAMHATAANLYAAKSLDSVDRLPAGACASGFVHGTIETALVKEGPSRAGVVARACDAKDDESSVDHLSARECYHGLGHGFRSRWKRGRAIQACEQLRSQQAVSKCAAGLFMQEFNDDDRSAVDPEVCNPLATPVEVGCFASLGMASKPGRRTERACASASTPAGEFICLRGAGRSLWAGDKGAGCERFEASRAVASCVEGFIRGNMYEARTLTTKQALASCGARSSRRIAETCASQVGMLVRAMGKDVAACKRRGTVSAACRTGYEGEVADTMRIDVV